MIYGQGKKVYKPEQKGEFEVIDVNYYHLC